MSIRRFESMEGTVVACRINVLSPMHQGTFADLINSERIDFVEKKEGNGRKLAENFLPINTTKIWSPDYGWIDVPIISGNSLRGRMRRAAAKSFFDLLREGGSQHEFMTPFMRNNVTMSGQQQWVASLFLNGGVVHKKEKTNESNGQPANGTKPPEYNIASDAMRDEIEETFVPLGLFGYVDGKSRLMPSKFQATNLMLHCDETDPVIASWHALDPVLAKGETVPKWVDAIMRRGGGDNKQGYGKFPRAPIVRSDSGQRIFNRFDSKSDEQMFAFAEYLPAGVHLYGMQHIDPDTTPVQRGCFYEALAAVAGRGFIGGMNARGYGHVSWDVDLPDDIDEDVAAYHEFVKHNAAKAEKLFDQLAASNKKNGGKGAA